MILLVMCEKPDDRDTEMLAYSHEEQVAHAEVTPQDAYPQTRQQRFNKDLPACVDERRV